MLKHLEPTPTIAIPAQAGIQSNIDTQDDEH
jgi:hypothetical protein